MNWKKPGSNCIKRVQNATESLLMAINGFLTVYVHGPNDVQHIRTLNLRGTNRAAWALMVAKNITFEPRCPRSSYAHLRSVPFDFGLHYVPHLCHVSSRLYSSEQYKREHFPLLAIECYSILFV